MHPTIHRESHGVGGNCVEISQEESRIILDIGFPTDEHND